MPSITPETAAAAREARRHLAAAKADIARAESILEASDVGRWPDAGMLSLRAGREIAGATDKIQEALDENTGQASGDGSGPGDNDTATDKPPPRKNEVGP